MGQVVRRAVFDGKGAIAARRAIIGNGIPALGRSKGAAKDDYISRTDSETREADELIGKLGAENVSAAILKKGSGEMPGQKTAKAAPVGPDENGFYPADTPDDQMIDAGVLQRASADAMTALTALRDQLRRLVPSVKRRAGINSASEAMDAYISGAPKRVHSSLDAYLNGQRLNGQ